MSEKQDNIDEELLEEYSTEAREHCERAEEILLGLENGIADRSMLDELFRIAHSIKGTGMGVGIEILPDFVHDVEDVLSKLREGGDTVRLPESLVSVLLRCFDHIWGFIQAYPEIAGWEARFEPLTAELLQAAKEEPEEEGAEHETEAAAPERR